MATVYLAPGGRRRAHHADRLTTATGGVVLVPTPTPAGGVRHRLRWRAVLGGLLLVGLVPLLSACTPTVATSVAPAAGLSTPVPPSALATLPPARPPRPSETPAGPAVSIENFNFTPAELTVPVGTTVVWTNHDDVDHTVTASDGSFGSPSIPTDGQFTFTFTRPGTDSYFCAIHPFMTARITVQ
jgi:plastocyanin